MRLITILLLACFLQVSARGFGQEKITLSLQNAPLSNVFRSIQEQTGYTFTYDRDVLWNTKPVDIIVNGASLHDVLNICFRDQPLTYLLDDRIIVVKKSKITSKADVPIFNKDIKGRVVNSDGESLEGIYVSVKGTNKRTVTNQNGEFSIIGIDDQSILVFSGIAIETLELKTNDQSDLGVIQLKTRIVAGEEVTINTGYQRVRPERTTGSYENVDNTLFNRSVTTNVLDRLDGIVPGLIFNRNISSASNLGISIRGISTLFSSQQPLIVVDNFPYEGDITNINPNDVESVTVLKDAAAASIWGTKAGNGVIVITTKSGKYNQKTRVAVNSNITVIEKPDLYYIPSFTSADYIDVEQFLFNRGYYNGQLNNTNTFPVVSPAVEIFAQRRAGLISSADSAAQIDLLKTYDIRKDYLQYLYRNTINQQNSVSVSGGGNNINYLFSVGIDNNLNNRSLIGNDTRRLTLRLQNNIKINKNLEMQIMGVYTNGVSSSNNPGTITPAPGRRIWPYARLADDAGNHLSVTKDFRNAFTDTAGAGRLLDWKYRPLDELDLADNTTRSNHFQFTLGGRYNVTSWANISVNYQVEKGLTTNRNYLHPQSYTVRNQVNYFTPTGGIPDNSAIPLGGILEMTTSDLISHSVRNQLNINKTWQNKHELLTIAGFEVRHANRTAFRNRTYGYDEDVLSYRNVDFVKLNPTYLGIYGNRVVPNNLSFSDNLDRFVSFYANGSYTYDRRYTFSLSARRDASNLFGVTTNNRWKPLWSAGGLWNVLNESFFSIDFLSELKLRATYGYSGNVNNSVPALLTISSTTPANLTNLPAYFVNNPPNPTLRWENVAMFNVGIDFANQNRRLSGSVEFYTKKSTDLLSGVVSDPTTGYNSLTLNTAILKGKGIDIAINTKNIDGEVKWHTAWLFSYNTNKVAKYLIEKPGAAFYIGSGISINPIEGENAYSILSWKWAGLDPLTGDPQGYLNHEITKDYLAIDRNSELSDLVVHGSVRPLYFGSVRNMFSWKGLSLSANITYSLKYYFRRPNTLSYFGLFSTGILEGYRDFINRWQNPGDELFTNVPSMIYPVNNNRESFYTGSEVTVEKGDHIRFRDINIGYTLQKGENKRLPFHTLSFYFYLNNLGIIWKANRAGLDPDYGTPPPRSAAFGIKANF